MDTSRTINKMGAKKVYVVYRRAREQMPAEQKEIDDAAFELSEALLKYFPDELKFINLCGAIKYLEGSYEDALAFFNKALALSPDDDIVIGNIAQVNFALGRFDEVEKLCDQVLSRENADPEMVKFVRDLKAKAQDRR